MEWTPGRDPEDDANFRGTGQPGAEGMSRRERRRAEQRSAPEFAGADELAAPPGWTPAGYTPPVPAPEDGGWSPTGATPPAWDTAGTEVPGWEQPPASTTGWDPEPPSWDSPASPGGASPDHGAFAALGLDDQPLGGEAPASPRSALGLDDQPLGGEAPASPRSAFGDPQTGVFDDPASGPIGTAAFGGVPFDDASFGDGADPGHASPSDSLLPTASESRLGEGTPLVDFGDLARPLPWEWVAFALAFLVPPAGLAAGIAAAVTSLRRRGWTIALDKLTIVISLVMSVVAGIAATIVFGIIQDAREFDATVAASAPFCAEATAEPATLEPPLYNWPQQGFSIQSTLDEMQAFVDRWDALVELAPAGLREGAAAIPDAGRSVIEGVTASRQIDNDRSVESMLAAIARSGVAEWVETYCSPAS